MEMRQSLRNFSISPQEVWNPSHIEEEAGITTLSEDTFSFLIVAHTCSISFITGILVLVVKTTMYTLILADMLTKGTPNNVLGIPASLELPVLVSQVLAVAITVITQDDLITALQLIHRGYYGIGSSFEHTYFMKWLIPLLFLSLVGAYGLLVTFLLIITSSDVVDLILNFTAIEFISLLDNIVFSLSSSGLFGAINRSTARLVSKTKIPQTKQSLVPWLQIALLLASFIGMICGLITVVFLQASGYFLPFSIIVQFDDEVFPSLSTYSGEFVLENAGAIFTEDRVVYRNKIGGGTIGFCSDLEAWTFGHSRTNYCENVLAMSESPTSRDISLILGQTWYIRMSSTSGRVLPMDGVYSAATCSKDLDCGGSERGLCVNFRCVCLEGFFGLRCNYVDNESCETIKVDELTDPFTGLRRKVSQEYKILRDPEGRLVTAYFHPVYVDSNFDNINPSRSVDVIIYAGLRWVLSSVNPPRDGLHTLFSPFFHVSEKSLGNIEATTEKVSFNTAADEASAPTGLEWFLPGSSSIAEIDPVMGINTVFLCSRCGPFFPCAYGNECDDSGTCICIKGEVGSICQVIPIGDGRCDQFFNKPEFDFDGGDCCESSCSSGLIHQCGILELDGLDSIPIGFPYCIDPAFTCGNGEVECWSRKSNDVSLLIKKSSTTFVTLSANGRTLVVSEPELDTVRVFDQVDADWEQRGQALQGEGRSRFGSLVSIATLPGTVYRRRSGKIPITLAIAAVGETTNYVEVYKFDPHSTEWSRDGAPIRFSETIDSIAIGGQGSKFLLAIGLRNSNRCHLYLQDDILNWRLAFNASGSGVALSGNGEILACISTDAKDIEGSGIFRVRDVTLPTPHSILEANKLKLPDLLPFGAKSVTFQSRPVTGVIDYMGTYGAVWGQLIPGKFGCNGFAMLGLKLDPKANASVTNRIAEVGFDVFESMPEDVRPVYSVSPDTNFLAINSQKTIVELFHVVSKDDEFSGVSIKLNTSTIDLPSYSVKGFQNKFAISNQAETMAVVEDDHVAVAKRSLFCNGSIIRLAITLDEKPDTVSWYLDYVGYPLSEMIDIPVESISKCDACYKGDPRYTRVVVVEDFCVPKDRVNCVQFTFDVSGRRMGDGAGFIAMRDGKPFSIYSGDYETRKSTLGGKNCSKICPKESRRLDFVMNFKGGFPSELRSPIRTLWSSKVLSTSVEGDLLLFQECLFSNESGLFELFGSGGIGNWTLYIDDQEKAKQVFDIGKSQVFELDIDKNNVILENVPALCSGNCSTCNVCPIGMIPDDVDVSIEGFNGISCVDLANLGANGGINPKFCTLFPKNISSLCGCYQAACPESESTIKVEIEFDNFPEDNELIVTDDRGKTLWYIDFKYHIKGDASISEFQSCVPKAGPLHFTISDRKHDGLCCETDRGFFLVGARKFPMGSEQSLALRSGNESSQVTIYQTPVWCADCKRCKVCPGDQDYNLDESIHFELYGNQNCFYFAANTSNMLSTEFCTEIQDHVSSSCVQNFQPTCSQNESLLTLKTEIEDAVGTITFQIRDENNLTMWTKSGFKGPPFDIRKYQTCVPTFKPFFVGVRDFCGEGKLCRIENRMKPFEIFLNKNLLIRQPFTRSFFEFAFHHQ